MKKTLGENQAGQSAALFTDNSESLPIALMRARAAVMSYFRPKHLKQGMTDPQWRVLRVLYRDGDMEVTQLAKLSVLMTPSLSRILRDFEKRGFIKRSPVAGDLRRSLVSITAKGVKRLARGEAEVNEIYQSILSKFGKNRMSALLKLLGQLEVSLTDGEGFTLPADKK